MEENLIQIVINKDGHIKLYNDTYDITVHCKTPEGRRIAVKMPQNCPGWIPVGEKLPKDPSMVLITWVNKYLKDTSYANVATYCDGEWYWYDGAALNCGSSERTASFECDEDRASEDIEVVAWLPFPEPYKVVQK